MDWMKTTTHGLAALLLAVMAGTASARLPHSTPITIDPDGQAIQLDLELAACQHQRLRGLQGRHTLADKGGMLFLIEPMDKVSMWMKDTHIALDILFVDEQRRIVGLEKATTPLSLRAISSPGEVAAVVELNAGFIDRTGIRVGQRVDYQRPAFDPDRDCPLVASSR